MINKLHDRLIALLIIYVFLPARKWRWHGGQLDQVYMQRYKKWTFTGRRDHQQTSWTRTLRRVVEMEPQLWCT